MKLKKKTKSMLQQLVLTPKKVHQHTFRKRLPGGRRLDWDTKNDIFNRKKFFHKDEEFSVVGIDTNEKMMSESNSLLQVANVGKELQEVEPPISCGVCKKTFTVERKYNDHVKRAHQIKTKETKTSLEAEEGNTSDESEARSCTPEIPPLAATPEVSSLISTTPELSPSPELRPTRDEPSALDFATTTTNDQTPDENKNNYCKVCNKTFSLRKVYRQHVKKVHHVTLTPLKKLIHDPLNPPDPNDPNHFCAPCDKHYYNRFIYRKHLRQVHKLFLLTVPRASPDPTVQPNPDDPDFFCQSCHITYDSQQKYRQHLKYVHYIKTDPPKPYPVHDPALVVDVTDPENTSCHICKKDYLKKTYYSKHMKKAHGNGDEQPVAGVPTRSDVQPDINDPKHHCRACCKTLASRWTYLRHLKLIHDMTDLPASTRSSSSSNKVTKTKSKKSNHASSSSRQEEKK